MQKYSHTSRRVQKELGGNVYALSERVDAIETELGSTSYSGDTITEAIAGAQSNIGVISEEIGSETYTGDSITEAIAGAQANIGTLSEDVTRLEGYEETTVKHFQFDIATATETTLQAVLENAEVMDWLVGTHKNDWTHMTINGLGNNTLNGTYGKDFSTKEYTGDLLSYKTFAPYAGVGILGANTKTLKADTTTGALSYGNTTLDITGGYTLINIYFKKGELS